MAPRAKRVTLTWHPPGDVEVGRFWARLVPFGRVCGRRYSRPNGSSRAQNDRVQREHERIVVTRYGRPAAVLISAEDLASLEETLEVLGDSDVVRAIRDADEAVTKGDVVRGVDAVRALRPHSKK